MQGKHFTLPAVLGLLAAARARAASAERRCRSRPRPRQFAWISQSRRRRRWKVVCLSSFHTKEHRVGAQTQHNNLHTQSLMFCSQSVGGGGGFFNPWVALLLVNIGSMGINLNALAHSLCHYIATSPLVHGLLSRLVPSRPPGFSLDLPSRTVIVLITRLALFSSRSSSVAGFVVCPLLLWSVPHSSLRLSLGCCF